MSRTRTDAIVEGVPMTGTMLEYRERQLVALEAWANKLEAALVQVATSFPKTEEGETLASIAKDVLDEVKP